ncbi:LexA-binding, inner membrane-associated putative hydrolase [uncultured archaeon]|nr:LexA-binding, inner membrane-associated putative hydrolase [uncultured archaeon]
MNWKTHLLLGAALGAAVCYFLFTKDALQVALAAVLAGGSALLPDIDIRNSKASKITYLILGGAALVAAAWLSFGSGKGAWEFALYLCAIVGGILIVDLLIRPRHRGITHSLVALAVVSVCAYAAAGLLVACAVAVGYFSHLLFDNSVKLS